MTNFGLNLRTVTPTVSTMALNAQQVADSADFSWWLLLVALWSESDEMFCMKAVDKFVFYHQLKFEIYQIHGLEVMLILPNLHEKKEDNLSQRMRFLPRSIQMH